MKDTAACPFCGGEPKLINDGTGLWWVQCEDCDAEGPIAHSEEEAIRLWNRRQTERSVAVAAPSAAANVGTSWTGT